MIRKQIYLTEKLQQDLSLRSLQEKKPEAVIIRELLEKALADTSSHAIPKALQQLDTLLQKHPEKAPSDLSTNLDAYLYGKK